MAPALPPRIEVKDLSYTFPDHSTGVRNITLDLPPRSRSLLIGANGAGKTTLLRILTGELVPDEGAVSHTGNIGLMRQFITADTVAEALEELAPKPIRRAAANLRWAEEKLLGPESESTAV